MSEYILVSNDYAGRPGTHPVTLEDALVEAARIFWFSDASIWRIEDENGNVVAGRAEIDKAIDEFQSRILKG